MELLNHQNFYDMIVSGAQQIIKNKKELNEINVFPVADGDTGSNLTFLMEMIVRETRWKEPSHEMLKKMKLACLRGSRGNSGMIFSQFIISMCNFLLHHHELKDDQFLDMCEQSVEKAYRSVANPQEGTILTVMQTWVKVMREVSERSQGIQTLMRDSFSEVCVSLENTKNQMEVLRNNNVVDAGAKGFVHFLLGLIESMKASTNDHPVTMSQVNLDWSSSRSHDSLTAEEPHVLLNNDHIEYRYCSEFLFEVHTDLSEVKKQLTTWGDSFIIVGDNDQGKVHIHTNAPEQVADIISQNGSIIYQKIEDMRRQQESIYSRKASIAIVIDSACDIPQEWMDKYQIHLLPLHLQLGNSSYLDKMTIDSDNFYNKLEQVKEQPKSSQPNLETITLLYSQLLQNYDHVLSIHLSKSLSGTYEACRLAAEQMDSARIHVINSSTLSGAYGLLVLRAAKAITLQQQTIEEVKSLLSSLIPKSEIFVSVPTLKHMVRGGRVTPLQGKVAKWLNMKPIVSLDSEGKSLLYGKTFFRKSNLSKMFQLVQNVHRLNPIDNYVILHANARDNIAVCEQEMVKITGKKPLYISSVSSVIGMNAGKGAVSIAMLLSENNKRGNK